MAARAKKKNLFGMRKALAARQTTPARGGAAAHAKRTAAEQAPVLGNYGGYRIWKDAGGEFHFSGDPDSAFATLRGVKAHIDWLRKGRGNPRNPEVQTQVVESEVPVFRSGSKGFPGVEYMTSYPELNQAIAYAQAVKGVYPGVGVVCLEESEQKVPGGDYAVVLDADVVRAVEAKQVGHENPRMELTREIAWAAAFDAGNRSMRKAGRTKWSKKDRDAAVREFYRLWPLEKETGEKIGNPALRSDAYRRGYEDGRAHVGASNSTAAALIKRAKQAGFTSRKDVADYVDGFRNALRARGMKRNPEQGAADMYESFHGRRSDRVIEVTDELHEHAWLAEIGTLVSLEIETPTGLGAEIEFTSDQPKLAANEDGSQLFVVGGNQAMDLKRLKMDSAEWKKESMVLGWIWVLTYNTEKDFDKFESVDYYHNLSEQERGSMEKRRKTLPSLRYDTVNEKLYIDGGKYRIEKPLVGTSPGIEN